MGQVEDVQILLDGTRVRGRYGPQRSKFHDAAIGVLAAHDRAVSVGDPKDRIRTIERALSQAYECGKRDGAARGEGT